MTIDKKNLDVIPPKTKVLEENIPDELKKMKYWGLWQWRPINGIWTKVPVSPSGSSIDAKAFCFSFKKAFSYYQKYKHVSGVGFYFSKDHDILGVDFDDCIVDGVIAKKVQKKIDKFGSYWENSVSGTGIHIVGKGAQLLNGVDRKFVYGGSRYFTFTGQGKGKLKNIGKKTNKIFGKEKKIDQPTTGEKESEISIKDLYKIVMNIRPDLPEPDWFLVCKAIHFKTQGSEKGWKLFNSWSAGEYCEPDQEYKQYNESDCIQKWNRCKIKENNVGLPTLRDIESRYPVSEKTNLKITFQKSLKLLEYNQFILTLENIPKNMRETVTEIARFNKVSVDPVITTMLMVFSAAIAKKVKIVERDGLSHNCSMGAIIGMPSGGRKSAIDRPLIYPFKEYEKAKMKEWEQNQANNKAEFKVLTSRYKAIEKDDALDDKEKIDMLAVLEKRLSKLKMGRPKFIESDATEERLSDTLNKNNETMFIHSDDARNTIKNITGRYDSTSENIYITGLTGDTYRRSRVKDDVEIVLYNPCINLSLKVQLDLLRELVTKTSMRESGLLARMFIKVLDDNVAEQFKMDDADRDLDYTKMEAYDKAIKAVLDYEGSVVYARMSKEARLRWIEFSNEYAKRLETDWVSYKDISNKIVSLSVKMATVITVMKNPNILETSRNKFGISSFEISEKSYLMAKNIVMVLMQQTLDVLNKLEENDIIKGAIVLYERLLADKHRFEWTMSDIKFKYSNNNRTYVESWVNCLLDNGLLELEGIKYSLK